MSVVSFLGHGRALETYLVGVKILFGIFIFPVPAKLSVAALSDLQWFYSDPTIAAPFFIIGIVQGVGLILNAKGYEISWLFRAGGALAAIMLWSALITKSILIGAVSTGIMPFLCMSLGASIFILYKALNGLPAPGAAGLQ